MRRQNCRSDGAAPVAVAATAAAFAFLLRSEIPLLEAQAFAINSGGRGSALPSTGLLRFSLHPLWTSPRAAADGSDAGHRRNYEVNFDDDHRFANGGAGGEDDRARRKFLLGAGGALAASALPPLVSGGSSAASAHPGLAGPLGATRPPTVTIEDREAVADGRVALEISSENLPTSRTSPWDRRASNRNAANNRALCEDPEAQRIAIFERAAPSVVYIDTFIERQDAFSTNVMEVPLGAGSGFVWDDKGHIVTNYHVVRNARSAQVAILSRMFPGESAGGGSGGVGAKLASRDDKEGSFTTGGTGFAQGTSPYTSMRPGRISSSSSESEGGGESASVADFTRKVYKAKVVGVDPGKDIAVLKVDAPMVDLYPLELGSSKGLRVGQSVMAIGNPFGLDHTLTTGVVSGVGREVKSPVGRPISNVIQTDAAINPGNSGGPLLDSMGRLIGMNTAIYSPSGASAGIGFAIPADAVSYIVETLIRDGKIIRPVLGISYLESKQAKALGITRGVLVLDVPQSSPAYAAGMRGTRRTEAGLIEIGDIIVGIDGDRIDNESDLFASMERYKPGDVVRVRVNRTELEMDEDNVGRSRLKMAEVTLEVRLKASSTVVQPAMLVPQQRREGAE